MDEGRCAVHCAVRGAALYCAGVTLGLVLERVACGPAPSVVQGLALAATTAWAAVMLC